MKSIANLVFTFFSICGFGQNAALQISELTEDFFIYTTYKDLDGYRFPSNGMYVVTDIGVVLLDTPWDESQFQPLLDSISKKHQKPVVLCVATHYHDDRTAGLEFFKGKGIKTYTSKQTYDLCKTHHLKQPEFYFTKDTTFVTGNHNFEVHYPGAGHTKDNIVAWFGKEKILYGGCLIKSTENNGLGNIADANLPEWETTIKKLIKKYPRPAYVIPGHFGWNSNKSLQHTLKLLQKNK